MSWLFRFFFRDYLAAKAMHALWSNPFETEKAGEHTANVDQLCQGTAMAAYRMADAMLEARK